MVGSNDDDHRAYGDRHPLASAGRLVVCGLTVGGIALLGAATAMLAFW